MIEDLEMFWDSDRTLTETDWMAEVATTVETLKRRIG